MGYMQKVPYPYKICRCLEVPVSSSRNTFQKSAVKDFRNTSDFRAPTGEPFQVSVCVLAMAIFGFICNAKLEQVLLFLSDDYSEKVIMLEGSNIAEMDFTEHSCVAVSEGLRYLALRL
ncbi:unnamed protein product [Toxocara canis]|uniref:Uncharacterized protein n=1 Tax=Toxocara canis TaxID=6265 RepID=A0A183V7I2_TOXCA|nr:unnamed protein product [Toxocara canis]